MTPAAAAGRSWWGWGSAAAELGDDRCRELGALIPGSPAEPLPVPAIGSLELPAPRVTPPPTIPATTDPAARLGHGRGKAFRDVVRNLAGDVGSPPDAVLQPTSDAQVADVLEWATSSGTPVVPYGGGSSVVGGVEFRGEGPWISLDLTELDRVLEVDGTSRAARIQAGVLGPALEAQLRPTGMTLRFFPQSFEFSSLGGWLATRAGGHYATGLTHIDDLVESIRMLTPAGPLESRRLPSSGAGPSPDRLMLGSEGCLGVITEAWVRLQDRTRFRASAATSYADMTSALAATRAVAQSGLHPSNCRLLDADEVAIGGIARDGRPRLLLAVESGAGPVDTVLDDLLDLTAAWSGRVESRSDPSEDRRDDTSQAWREAFLEAPYRRDALARMGAIVETFETATTWDRVAGLYTTLRQRMREAIQEVTGAPGLVGVRITHVYPDGAALYVTVVAGGRRGSQLAMWDALKGAAMEVVESAAATVTHHHGVGRDHRPGYDRQRPPLFAAALTAARSVLDPAGVMNPGVLIG